MSLANGTKLGPYEILSPIGKGGMGEVFRARDSKLDRDVAIKVLPDFYVRDPERVARFEREAKVLASLDHPNIASIYGFDESNGIRFLALEFVEGETLSKSLKNGPVAVEDALDIAKQIAEALEAAHEQGVIHRDLKPANVMVRPDGTIKVLDFGLAKATSDEASGSQEANSPTITANFTRPGVVLGSAGYMSPEQARGRALDKRTDIWSFGIILFECLSGQQLFVGETANDSMGAIMHKEPDWTLLPANTPPTIQLLLRRCLTKDRKRRLHDIADARIELVNALVDPASTSLGLARAALDVKRRWLPSRPAVMGFAVLLALTAVGAWFAKPEPPKQLWNLTLSVPQDEGYEFVPWGQGVAISSDGRQVVLTIMDTDTTERKRRLLLRRTDQPEGVILANTEGARDACFSPDGTWIAFSASKSLKKISTRGGPATTICQTDGWLSGPEWGKDGTIVFFEYLRKDAGSGLRRVSANGGTPDRLTSLDADSKLWHMRPHFLPDGSGITFSAGDWNTKWDEFSILALRFADKEPREIIKGGSDGVSLATGHLVYRREQTLMAAPFDLSRLEITAPAVPMLEGIGGQRASQASRVAISPTGTLIFLPYTGGDEDERSLMWVDQNGEMTPLSTSNRNYQDPKFSPDGRHVSVVIGAEEGEEENIYILERQRDLLRRLTSDEVSTSSHAWSPDGKWIVFASERDGDKPSLYRIPSDFSGKAERLTNGEHGLYLSPTDISPDGRLLTMIHDTPERESDVSLLPLDDHGQVEGEARSFVSTPSWDFDARFSPDGKWIAYGSFESEKPEIYVRATEGSGAAVQVSTEGGTRPRWSPTENKLYFTNNWDIEAVYSVSFSSDDGQFKPELPELVFKLDAANLDPASFEVSPDGQGFLTTIQPNGKAEVWTNPRIILNWFEDLHAKVPID